MPTTSYDLMTVGSPCLMIKPLRAGQAEGRVGKEFKYCKTQGAS